MRLRRADRVDDEAARVELFDQPADGAALAGGVPALEDQDRLAARVVQAALELQDPKLRPFEALFVLILVADPRVEIDIREFDYAAPFKVTRSP